VNSSRGGRPPSQDPKVARVAVKLTSAEWLRARVEAARLGISVGDLLRRGLAPESGLTRGDTSATSTTRRA
jgi:hypothetical protein